MASQFTCASCRLSALWQRSVSLCAAIAFPSARASERLPALEGPRLLQAREAETRLEYAVHYGIPYPRLHHAPQFPKRYVMDTPQMPDGPQHATGCAPDPARLERQATFSLYLRHTCFAQMTPPVCLGMHFKCSYMAGRRTILEPAFHTGDIPSIEQSVDQ